MTSAPPAQPLYESADTARAATDEFYSSKGFEYTDEQVKQWLGIYLPHVPATGAVLDLCCGDGIWSRGIKAINPKLRVHGIDISAGGIEKARTLVKEDAANFVAGDAEAQLPWPGGTFDMIFARGPGLFNQHCMDRPATIAVIEMWHRALKPGGKMISIFYSNPELFGTYTNPLKVALPYNRAPRLTDAVDFTGGKYHHDIHSFLAPFRKAERVRMGEYRFVRNNHILETMLA
ncbi:MAG TPA: class I SAM-dependent methyltransferase [Phycisphaerales bacterium]|nr:class I SAM-dependent methyltransferase [Phycisphaerales bacterium]